MPEIRSLVIGEQGEYGRRLAGYIEQHAPPSLRLYRFTGPDMLSHFGREADCYILDRSFQEVMGDKEKGEEAGKDRRCIYLSEEEEEGCFCIYEPPAKILSLIGLGEKAGGTREDTGTCMVAGIYSPVFDEDLSRLAMTYMKEGDLYLGFEDLGPVAADRANVGDLCYYIHLREENILDTLEDLCDKSKGIFVLESPDLFFYLRELTMEDYQWFFDRVRASLRYEKVFLGIGNGFLARPEALSLFDRLYLVDSQENDRRHALCQRLKWAINGESIGFRGQTLEIIREKVLNGGWTG